MSRAINFLKLANLFNNLGLFSFADDWEREAYKLASAGDPAATSQPQIQQKEPTIVNRENPNIVRKKKNRGIIPGVNKTE